MGKYVKVYLTEEEAFALEALQVRRSKASAPGTAANAIIKEGVRNLLVAEGVLLVSGGPMVVKAVRPSLEPVPEKRGTVRRRRRSTS